MAALCGGEDHLFTRTRDGVVRSWGNNDHGELGEGTTDDRRTPTEIPWLKGASQIAPGKWHTCVLDADGVVSCWGYNASGELGHGPSTPRLEGAPVTVNVPRTVKQLVAGNGHTCVLLKDGTVSCWGSGSDGQLGSGHPLTQPPTAVPKLRDVTEIAVGGYHTCALLADTTVRCWGRNSDGQVGDGTTQDRDAPVEVKGLEKVTHLDLGEAHSLRPPRGRHRALLGEQPPRASSATGRPRTRPRPCREGPHRRAAHGRRLLPLLRARQERHGQVLGVQHAGRDRRRDHRGPDHACRGAMVIRRYPDAALPPADLTPQPPSP